jgi:hypothetical protein
MNFLINIYKQAKKGDNFRMAEPPSKYSDKIVQMNAQGADLYRKLDSATVNKINRTNTPLVAQSSNNTASPGAKF